MLTNLAAGSFLLWVAVGFRPKISIESFCLFSVHLMCFKWTKKKGCFKFSFDGLCTVLLRNNMPKNV